MKTTIFFSYHGCLYDIISHEAKSCKEAGIVPVQAVDYDWARAGIITQKDSVTIYYEEIKQ